jgi:hypothetical protein
VADRTKSGQISTAKARRKDLASKRKALGLATRGRTKQNASGPATGQAPVQDLVPLARDGQAKPATYVIAEHLRRDTGAVTRALDLTAPDAPADHILPATAPGPDGDVILEFAVQCLTHNSDPVHYGTAAQARREVKSSHKWCAGCRGDLARTPATRSKAARQAIRRDA